MTINISVKELIEVLEEKMNMADRITQLSINGKSVLDTIYLYNDGDLRVSDSLKRKGRDEQKII